MEISSKLKNKIVKFLISIPNIDDSNSQRALVYDAGLDPALLQQISFGTPSGQFIRLLVSTCISYGILTDGRNPIETILESAKDKVGLDKRRQCNEFIQELCIAVNHSNSYVQIIIEGDVSDFNETKRHDITNVIAGLLNVDREFVRILHVLPGSIKIIVELPPNYEKELIEKSEGLSARFPVKEIIALSNREKIDLLSSNNEKVIIEDSKTNRQNWIRQLKFRIDPFQYPDGAHDPNLAQYFYRRPEFPEILGSVSKLEPVLVFGVPGSGKSSSRNAIAQLCQSDEILPILYCNFKPLAGEIKGNYAIEVRDHIEQILKVSIETLENKIKQKLILCQQSPQENRLIEDIEIIRKRLWAYVSKYETNFLRKRHWEKFLQQNNAAPEELPTDPKELIAEFCQCITNLLGYQGIYFLVDPDEAIIPDVDVVWRLLEPLLADFSLLDLSSDKAAFKFFLNRAYLSRVLNIPWIAHEKSRGIYNIHLLEWSDEKLLALLKERLRLCSERIPPYTSLGAFSEVADIDNLIIQQAEGKPRKLITICNMLFNTHAHAFIDREHLFITQQEIEETFQQLTITEPDPIAELIAQGENMQIEFKSTMRWNLSVVSFKPSQTFKDKIPNEIWDGLRSLEHQEFKEEKDFWHAVEQKIGKEQSSQYKELILRCLNIGKRDEEMDKTIAKTLCGFMNHEDGGILIIGVNDHGEPVGLEYDFNTLKRKDKDGFERAFNDLVKIYLDIEYRENIRDLNFKNYREKQICVVEVKKSKKPVFYCFDDEHEFYVRVGNSTKRLDSKSAIEYVNDHFEK